MYAVHVCAHSRTRATSDFTSCDTLCSVGIPSAEMRGALPPARYMQDNTGFERGDRATPPLIDCGRVAQYTGTPVYYV